MQEGVHKMRSECAAFEYSVSKSSVIANACYYSSKITKEIESIHEGHQDIEYSISLHIKPSGHKYNNNLQYYCSDDIKY